jgi:hypothetical protein
VPFWERGSAHCRSLLCCGPWPLPMPYRNLEEAEETLRATQGLLADLEALATEEASNPTQPMRSRTWGGPPESSARSANPRLLALRPMSPLATPTLPLGPLDLLLKHDRSEPRWAVAAAHHRGSLRSPATTPAKRARIL